MLLGWVPEVVQRCAGLQELCQLSKRWAGMHIMRRASVRRNNREQLNNLITTETNKSTLCQLSRRWREVCVGCLVSGV